MNIHQHYIKLREHFETVKDGELFPVTMNAIVEVLGCTQRNAQLIIQRMIEEKLVTWEAGRGRGNKSKLLFLRPLHQIIFEMAKKLALAEKVSEAWKRVEGYPGAKFEFTNWVYKNLGFHESDNEDTMRFPFYRPIPDLDPTFVSRRTEAHLVSQIFNKLVKIVNGEVVADLAHLWESDKGDSVWRFYLCKGVRFHHGRALTSKDVEYTFLRSIKYSQSDIMRKIIKEIRILGKYTIEFILTESNAFFVNILCSERYSILPSELDEINLTRPFSRLPIGTGPFRIIKNNDSIIQLEAHEAYFSGRPWLDRIEIWIWSNYHPSKAPHRIGEDDLYIGGVPAKQSSHKQLSSLEEGAFYLCFNMNKVGPLQDPLFRAAVHFGIDRLKMIKDIGGALEAPSCSFFTKYSKAFYKNEYDLQLAKSLLAQSSYNDEVLYLYTYAMPSNEENAKWMKGELERLGINIELIVLPVSELKNVEVLGQADLLAAGEVLGSQEDLYLIEMLTDQNGFITNLLGSDERERVSEWITLCMKERNSTERWNYLISLQEELTIEHKVLFLYHSKQSVQHSQSLSGIVMNSWGNVDYKNIWIKR